MSEIKRWATEFLDAVDGQDVGFWMRSLARAILADTSPASQERDDLERIAEMADVLPAHCGDPEVLKALHDIRDKLRALARPSGGEGVKWEEHGAANLNPERWEGYKGVGGEGGDALRLARKYLLRRARGTGTVSLAQVEASIHEAHVNASRAATRLSGESAKWGGPNPPHLIDDDPELNGEPHEPDCPQATPYEVGSGEPCECTCGGEGAPEPDDRKILRRLYGAAIGNAVYPSVDWTDCATKDYQHLCDRLLGTPGPDRKADDGPETMERAWNHREAEIRADERRKVDEALSTAARAEKLAWLDAMDEGCPPDVAQGAQHAIDQLLSRLSLTDEQESPNRSDEP